MTSFHTGDFVFLPEIQIPKTMQKVFTDFKQKTIDTFDTEFGYSQSTE
jgi:hypothetical protein